jgi:hypothetical protein
LSACLIKRDYTCSDECSIQNKNDSNQKESQIENLFSHIAQIEISQENAAKSSSSLLINSCSNQVFHQEERSIINEGKNTESLFDDFMIDQPISEHENTININNNNNNNTTITSELEDFFQITPQQPYDTVTTHLDTSNFTTAFPPPPLVPLLNNQTQLFDNSTNEDITQSIQFQSVMQGMNADDFTLDDDLFSDFLLSETSDTQYTDNTQSYMNNSNFINNNICESTALTYTNLDTCNNALNEISTVFENKETIVLDKSSPVNNYKTIIEENATVKNKLPETMPDIDANGNPIVGYARSKSGKSSILITKIKNNKNAKNQANTSSLNQTKLKIIDDREQVLGLVTTTKGEQTSTSSKRKYDELMQTPNDFENKKALLPWEKTVKESNKNSK